jgi:hypothetical protein
LRRADIIAGLILTLAGLITIFVIVPREVGSTSPIGIAPDVFPLTLLWTITALSVLLVVLRLVTRPSRSDGPPLELHNIVFIGVAAIALAAGFIAIATLGFLAGGAAIVAFTMLVMGARRYPLRVVLVAALAPTAIFLVFKHVFTVFLP